MNKMRGKRLGFTFMQHKSSRLFQAWDIPCYYITRQFQYRGPTGFPGTAPQYRVIGAFTVEVGKIRKAASSRPIKAWDDPCYIILFVQLQDSLGPPTSEL